ncbi:host attachment protein [Microbaculum marinum]|uniref:Host attachment protein n=1 Tax=Microbaculum marinum TaxID=1764581 RepID=A0AAW9RGZ5_9HYPH
MNRDLLAELSQSHGFPRLSIYIPTHRTFPDAEQDPIRLANALRHAERQLDEAGVRHREDLLSKAQARTEDHEYWRYQDHGLAVFIEEDATRFVKLPAEVPELTLVAERYHLLPLIDIFADRGRFHLLAATRDNIRFFDGTERDLDEVKLEDLPKDLEQVMRKTDFEDNVGYHSRGGGSGGSGAAVPKYHALGESPDDYEEVELEHFAHAIATAVDRRLADSVAPLVLAAGPRLLGRLRHELHYRGVVEEHVQQDPASLSETQLHDKAWAIAGPLLRRNRDETRERLNARLGGADVPGSEDLQTLLRASEEGRIEAVLLSRGDTVWGRYDESNRTMDVEDDQAPDNEDLLNLLAMKTLAQGGEVLALPEPLVERVGPAAGLFRF